MKTSRFIIIFLFGILSGASQAAPSATNLWNAYPPRYFTNELAAFTNGQAVLAAMKRGDEQSKKQIQSLIDSRAFFHFASGSGDKLVAGDNMFLEVEVSPQREWPRGSHAYAGEVVGVLKTVDFDKHVIHIKIQPEGCSPLAYY
jgi:hypothetical protein